MDNEVKRNPKKELDRILDKLSIVGYHKLSKSEKEFLKKFGDLIDKEDKKDKN